MEFREPRKTRQPSQYWLDVVKTLKANPGVWAMVGDYSAAVGSHIRNGTYPAFVPSNIADKRTYMKRNYVVKTEKVTGPDGKARYEVFIKYVGKD